MIQMPGPKHFDCCRCGLSVLAVPGGLGHHDVQEIGLIMVKSKAAMKTRRCGPLGSIAVIRPPSDTKTKALTADGEAKRALLISGGRPKIQMDKMGPDGRFGRRLSPGPTDWHGVQRLLVERKAIPVLSRISASALHPSLASSP